jgi:hypothetical protein
MKIIDPFTNISLIPVEDNSSETNGSTFLSDLRSLNIGEGSNVFRADKAGIWLGSDKFSTAPFSVSMAGAVTASSIILTGGTIKYGKTSFSDSTHSGYYISNEGIYFGSALDTTRLKYTLADGTFDFIGSHSGGDVAGVPIAQVGYVATSGSDATPSGLTCLSTSVVIASDGSVSASVVLNWTAISSNTFDHYVIRYKKGSYTYYSFVNTTSNTITIEGLTPNTVYNFGIASVNKYGSVSSYSADINQTTATSTVPPATVTAGSALGGIQYVIVQWTHNTEADLASYNVYRNTSNNSAGATLIANVRTNYFTDGGLTGGQPYYYWVKAVNTSGLSSVSFSSEVHATPRNVASSDANIAQLGWTQTCAFSVTDADTVAWGAGVFTASNGVSYNISAGNTGNMTARTYIYLDIAVSTTVYQTTTTANNAVGDGKVLIGVAQNGAVEAVFQIFGGAGGVYINGSDLVAGSVTTNEIAANTIKAGNIEAGTITATEIDTDTITSLDNLAIGAPQVLIDGTVYLSNWRHTSDLTKIDGGNIYANSVTTTQLNFTPVQSTDVIASINASAEGITIDADNISISGSTTFAAGYDPSQKTKTFVQGTIPTSVTIGDMWVNTSDNNKQYMAASVGASHIASGEWELVSSQGAAIFAQATIPTSLAIGDLWYDTDDGNKQYRAAIAGATTIGTGQWELVSDTNKLNAVGGAYSTALTGSRVLIFPDANTGIQVIDDAGADVFKIIVGGTDVGDVIIGNYAGGQGIKYDKSTGKTTFAGELSAPSGTLGTITAGTISGVTITGGTIRTDSGNTRVELDGTNNMLAIYYNGDMRGVFDGYSLTFLGPGEVGGGAIYSGGTNQIDIDVGGGIYYEFNESALVPFASGCDLGDSSYPWNNLYAEGTSYLTGKLKIPVGTNLY